MYKVGSQDLYQWLVTDDEHFDLLEVCPEIVLGKFVAITSIDSGVLLPNDAERRLVGKVEARLRTALKSKLLRVCRARVGTSGTYSTIQLI